MTVTTIEPDPTVHATTGAAAEAVAHAVRSQVLPSLAAFYSQDLTLLACTESYAAEHGATADALCGRSLRDVVGEGEHDQLIGPALRAVAGFTVHTTLRRRDGRGQRLTLVGYEVDGEQLGVAVLTGS
jgi:hypothetical protein